MFSPARRRWASFLATLILVSAYLWLDSSRHIRHLTSVSSGRFEAAAPAEGLEAPPSSPAGTRDQILSLDGIDGYQWIIHTENMLARKAWRIHHTEVDNPPGGREVHWSSGLIWWLALLGRGQAAVARTELNQGIERASLYATPLLLACMVILLSILTFRRFGAFPACALALAMVAAPELAAFFDAGYLDHHGIAAAAGLATVLFAAAAGAGWVRSPREEVSAADQPDNRPWPPAGIPKEEGARRWMIASGLAGSVGLWVSAASQVPILVGLGLGAVVGAIRWPRPAHTPAGLVYLPGLWRVWGWAAAAGSLFFYLLEYFPSSMGMRLEVNHPLYALACAGAGELLYRGCRRLSGGSFIESAPDRLFLILAALALAAAPAVIALSPERFFWVMDPFLWALHRGIQEFRSIGYTARTFGLSASLRSISVLPLLLLPTIWVAAQARLDRVRWGMLAVTAVPALIITLLAVGQVRWLGNEEALWSAVLVVWFSFAADLRSGLPRRGARVAAACFLALVVVQAVPDHVISAIRERRAAVPLEIEDRQQLVMRDVAQLLRLHTGKDLPIVLSAPTSTAEMVYFGGFRGVGTLYWENLAGLKSAAEIYAASTDEEARRNIESRSISHIISCSWDDSGEKLARLYRGLPPDQPLGNVFASRLLSPGTLPRWLRPVNYGIPPELGLQGQSVVIFEVRPEQTLNEQLVYLADFLLDRGDNAGALETCRRLVKLTPDQPVALFRLARALAQSGRTGESLQQIDRAGRITPAREAAALAEEVSGIGRRLSQNDPGAAIRFYRHALMIDPRCRLAMNNLAWALATAAEDSLRDGAEALRLAQAVVALDGGGDPRTLDTLAAAYARSGRWPEAVTTASRAVDLMVATGTGGADELRSRLSLYRAGQPYQERAGPASQP